MTKFKITKFSFIVFAIIVTCVAIFKLAAPFITILFSYLALSKFKFRNKTWIAVTLYLIVVTLVVYGFIFFSHQIAITFPEVAKKSIPTIIDYAQSKDVKLPFSDIESLKTVIVESVTEQVKGVTRFAQVATEEIVFLIISIVVAISLFLNPKIDLHEGHYAIKNNLYSEFLEALAKRFRLFYQSFATVMGAQVVISTINTGFTSLLVFALDLPYPYLIIALTFLCGLLPIIGNIISNVIITCIAVVESPRLAIVTLLFLIAIHKLEYFLNSKIIGGRIKNPMWLSLLALVVGERLIGIPGIILAPVVLYYLKLEGTQTPVVESEM